jgi:hypothetical protein
MSSTAPAPTLISEELRDGILTNIGLSGALGLVFNLLLSWVLIKKVTKRNAHGDIMLCTFIAITDVVLSLALIFRAIFGKYPYNIFKVHPYWCKFDLGFTSQLLIYSGYSLSVLSIERFFLICFNIKFPVYIWFILIFIAWGSHFTLVMMSLIQGMQVLTRAETQCTVLLVGISYILTYVGVAYFFTSFVIIITSYFCIMATKFRQCLNQINLNVPKDQVYIELRSTISKSIINILFYLFVYMPKLYVTAFELITGQKRTLMMDIVSNGTIVYSATANALILLYMNQEVRKSFIQLLKDIKSLFIKQS